MVETIDLSLRGRGECERLRHFLGYLRIPFNSFDRDINKAESD
jgi:hypothetical protein